MPNISTTQNALSTASEEVLPINSNRKFAEVKNVDSVIAVYLGADSSVSTSNGHKLAAGQSFGFENYTGPVWAVAASGTPTVTTIEW